MFAKTIKRSLGRETTFYLMLNEELELMRRDGEGSIVSPKASRTSYEFIDTIKNLAYLFTTKLITMVRIYL